MILMFSPNKLTRCKITHSKKLMKQEGILRQRSITILYKGERHAANNGTWICHYWSRVSYIEFQWKTPLLFLNITDATQNEIIQASRGFRDLQPPDILPFGHSSHFFWGKMKVCGVITGPTRTTATEFWTFLRIYCHMPSSTSQLQSLALCSLSLHVICLSCRSVWCWGESGMRIFSCAVHMLLAAKHCTYL
jgi:hypothetical protein